MSKKKDQQTDHTPTEHSITVSTASELLDPPPYAPTAPVALENPARPTVLTEEEEAQNRQQEEENTQGSEKETSDAVSDHSEEYLSTLEEEKTPEEEV